MDQTETIAEIPVVGFDSETHRFGPGYLVPKLVCLQVACGENQEVASASCPPDGSAVAALVDYLFPVQADAAQCRVVAHNAAFDLASLCGFDDTLIPRIFEALELGRVHCTCIREKLLNVTTHGKLDILGSRDGVGGMRLSYHLSDLVKKYMGHDISADKVKTEGGVVVEGQADAWRINFDLLENIPVDKWPVDAVQYAIDDAVYAENVYAYQEQQRNQIITERGFDPFQTEAFQVKVDFCLYLCSAWGMATDAEAKAVIEAHLKAELAPEKMVNLLSMGILRPAQPPKPHANGAKYHVDGCTTPKTCTCPPKMTQGTKESINETALKAFLVELCPNEVQYTDPSDRFPEGQVSLKVDWFEDHADLHPMFAEYHARAVLDKLVTTELPRMEWPNGSGITSPVVHPCYDVLKETGRTSSFASDAYPSFNIQNVDPRARGCYVPRPRSLLFSIDFSQMELVTLAQVCLWLFRQSVLADRINAGIDPHTYLGSQLAFKLHPEFQQACAVANANDPDSIYQNFLAMKSHPDLKELFKHYRNMAKPTGLGYPGGLGPKTFVTYAKHPYGVEVTIEQATELREIWFDTYPEMRLYFQYVNDQCVDPWNEPRTWVDRKNGGEQKTIQQYTYTSPLGMVRAGCDYCAACNGLGLQSPGAEGAKEALYKVCRQCYDPSLKSMLYLVVRPIGFIHDEIVGEIYCDDPKARYEILHEVGNVMSEAFRRTVSPDVLISAKPVLMERWDKEAEQVFDKDGNLDIWRPSE